VRRSTIRVTRASAPLAGMEMRSIDSAPMDSMGPPFCGDRSRRPLQTIRATYFAAGRRCRSPRGCADCASRSREIKAFGPRAARQARGFSACKVDLGWRVCEGPTSTSLVNARRGECPVSRRFRDCFQGTRIPAGRNCPSIASISSEP